MGEDAWHDTTVTHVTYGLPTQFQRRPYSHVQMSSSSSNIGALHAHATGVRPPPEFTPAPLKKADDAEKQAAYFRHWLMTRVRRILTFGVSAGFWFLVILVPTAILILYLPEILKSVFGLHKVPTSDGQGHLLVRAGVLDTLVEHCKEGVKAILVEDEVTAEAALDPLRRCREYAGQAVAKEHSMTAGKEGGGINNKLVGVLPSGVVVTSRSRYVADTVSMAVLAARNGQDEIDAGPPSPVAPPPAIPPSPACSTVTAENQLLYMAGRMCKFAPLPRSPPHVSEPEKQW